MGAPTEIYVDPAIAGASGAGTVGDPYGDIQHALDTVTRDSTNGDRFNIKAGTDEILAAGLTLATYGTPTETAPLYFQGYTSAAADGGIGGIDGNATYAMFVTYDYDCIVVKDMHVHNSGSVSYIIELDNDCKVINCEIDNNTGGGISLDSSAAVINCYIHNIGAIGVNFRIAIVHCTGCYFANGTNSFTTALDINAVNGWASVTHNIFSLSGTSDAIDVTYQVTTLANNSIFTTGSGVGARLDLASFSQAGSVCNNLFEGWTTGLLLSGSPTTDTAPVVGNAFFGCTTDYTVVADHILFDDNEALSVTPFDKSGSDTYALRATYFNPVNTGNVLTPYMGMGGAKGAIQPAAGNTGNQKAMYRKAFTKISVTLASDTTQDIWSLMAPSTNKIVLHGWELTSDATADSIIDINLHFISAVGSGGTAATVTYNPADSTASAIGVLRTEDTTPGTPSGALMSYQWEQVGPVGHTFTPEMRPVIDVSTGIALTCNTAATPTLSGWICWEEI